MSRFLLSPDRLAPATPRRWPEHLPENRATLAMNDNSADKAPRKSVFERIGDQVRSWMPDWYTDSVALFVIIVCLVLLMMGL